MLIIKGLSLLTEHTSNMARKMRGKEPRLQPAGEEARNQPAGEEAWGPKSHWQVQITVRLLAADVRLESSLQPDVSS